MVSKEAGRCALSNSESDSDSGGPTLGAEGSGRGDTVRKRNKALQVRFKDICEAQNEAARLARGTKGRSVSCKVVHRRYMTMPARRSIPNVTKSTAVQTSPDLKKRYQTFPFERKKGHTIKHTALVENYQGQNNGFLSEVKSTEEERPCGGRVQKTRVLLHSMPQCSNVQDLCAGSDCPDSNLCSDPTNRGRDATANSDQTDSRKEGRSQGTKHSESEVGAGQDRNCPKSSFSTPSTQPLQDRGGTSKVTGPIAWTSLTQVECLESPSVRCKRKKETAQMNGLQSQTLPHAASCSSQETKQAHFHGSHGFTSQVAKDAAGQGYGQVIPLPGVAGDVKARLQAMETLISSSQETIKVLLGVIQELEKGEAQREGRNDHSGEQRTCRNGPQCRLSYRTGQDTTNCDTCRNSACIIYSVELDFKLQEDKLQPLMKRLCPTVDPPYPSLPYPHEVITSTPKRKSKSEAKKHARWKLWFL